jgi:hypothetical protein
MPDIDEAVISALSETLQDVTFRANRLQEWMDLEIHVLKLVSSFEQFNDEVRRVFGSGPTVDLTHTDANTWTRLAALWESYSDSSLIDLDLCIGDLVYLNQEVVVGGGPVDLELDAWLDELKAKGDDIHEALITSPAPLALRNHCNDLDRDLRRRVSLHRQRVKKEIGILAEVTLLLRTRLETSLPSDPVNE